MASNAVDPTSNVEAPLITPLIAMKTAPLIAPAVKLRPPLIEPLTTP